MYACVSVSVYLEDTKHLPCIACKTQYIYFISNVLWWHRAYFGSLSPSLSLSLALSLAPLAFIFPLHFECGKHFTAVWLPLITLFLLTYSRTLFECFEIRLCPNSNNKSEMRGRWRRKRRINRNHRTVCLWITINRNRMMLLNIWVYLFVCLFVLSPHAPRITCVRGPLIYIRHVHIFCPHTAHRNKKLLRFTF